MGYVNLKLRKGNFVVDQGYFYSFDESNDVLLQKIDDGSTAFSYPLDTVISSAVKSLEHDKIYFWTLENSGGGNVNVKKWLVENSICNLKDTINLSPDYDSNAFTVEHYHTSVAATISGGDHVIQVKNYYDTVVSSGIVLTLGPNSSTWYEDVTVNSVSGTYITLTSGTQYPYDVNDEVNFYTNLWLFNNDGDGSLRKINAYTGALIATTSGSEYKNITACTFARVGNVFDSDVDALIYVKSTNLKFVNIATLTNYGIMTMDNLRSNGSTVIPVYDLTISGKTVYRLQDEATYYGADNDWGSMYNYQVSTVRPFIDSITVTAYPLILPANGYNVTQVKAAVFDQYGDGVVNKPVHFTDTDNVGFITINPAYTDYFWGTGEAKTAYKAGITPQTVTIEGTVTQYD